MSDLSERMRERGDNPYLAPDANGEVMLEWADEVAALEAKLAEHEADAGGTPMTKGEQGLMTELAKCKARCERLERDYSELIMEVVTKHESETRHETARRYIHEAENKPNGEAHMEALSQETDE